MKAKDITANYDDAAEVADRLRDYYHKRGCKWVKVWLEPEITLSGRKFYGIRSNIVFTVPRI